MAAGAREWAAAIGQRLGLPVSLRDERLSSFEAEQRLGRMKRGRSGGPPSRTQRNAFRARIDREAASVILQDELDARRGAGGAVAPAVPVLPVSGAADPGPEDDR
jgi:RNase H-fold protein (predicted Holliday junction resolvase)